MTTLRTIPHALSAATAIVAVAVTLRAPAPLAAEASRCSLMPGRTMALLHVERDTMLPFAPAGGAVMSYTTSAPGARDSLLATPGTPMPAARVRLLRVDSATRAAFVQAGISGDEPVAFLRAAPFRADCRVVRWTDTTSFVRAGETGFVRAELAPKDQWVGGAPVLVVSETGYYPYPHRRSLARGVAAGAPVASAEAMFAVSAALERPMARTSEARAVADSIRRVRALAWIAANPADAELDPVRTMLRNAVLDVDARAVTRMPSRLRGTYRVDMESGGARHTWFFRTHDKPGYSWQGRRPDLSSAALAASPWTLGYRLVGLPAGVRDSLPSAQQRPTGPRALVWLAAEDRPTAPGNDARRSLEAILEFTLRSVPEPLWAELEAFVPPVSAADSAFRVRTNRPLPRDQQQPELPLTLRLDDRGGVRADTTLVAGGRRLRVTLERVDTLAVKRPY